MSGAADWELRGIAGTPARATASPGRRRDEGGRRRKRQSVPPVASDSPHLFHLHNLSFSLRCLTSVRRVSHSPPPPACPEAVSHRADFDAGLFIIYQKRARLFPSDSVIALPSPNAAHAAPSASAAEDGGGFERGGETEGGHDGRGVRRVFLETYQLPHLTRPPRAVCPSHRRLRAAPCSNMPVHLR